jgi:hypothetical protein
MRQIKNATATRRVLSAPSGSNLADVRTAFGFDQPINISMPTLFGIAASENVQLKAGRPPLDATAKIECEFLPNPSDPREIERMI